MFRFRVYGLGIGLGLVVRDANGNNHANVLGLWPSSELGGKCNTSFLFRN